MKIRGRQNPSYLVMPLMLWAGMLIAISMEAVVKFKAPLVTLEIGVDVGRQVFPALMQAEWLLMGITTIMLLGSQAKTNKGVLAALFISLSSLLVQSLITLPALMFQADQLIAGKPYYPGHSHIWYVVLSQIKVVALFVASYLCIKQK